MLIFVQVRRIIDKNLVSLWSIGSERTDESNGINKKDEGEKNHKKGGLNCVFGNFFFNVLDNCSQVQSLSEFRVYVQQIK